MDDEQWRVPYLLLSVALSLTAAVLMTYFYERPFTDWLMERAPRWARPKKRGKKRETDGEKNVSEKIA